MSEDEWNGLFDNLERHMRELIDRHPVMARLPDLARRNAAYCAAWSALGAVEREDVEGLGN